MLLNGVSQFPMKENTLRRVVPCFLGGGNEEMETVLNLQFRSTS